jgi:hypothetical protein
VRKEGEVDLLEAMDMMDSPEEFFGKMVEAGKLKARRADGTIYFLLEEIEDLIDRQIEAVRHGGLEVGPGLDDFLLE